MHRVLLGYGVGYSIFGRVVLVLCRGAGGVIT
jgi:hypothetical protein